MYARRAFLKTFVLSSSVLLTQTAYGAATPKCRWFTGFKHREKGYGVGIIRPDLTFRPVFYSKGRLHDFCASPEGRTLLAPARRASTHLHRYDFKTQTHHLHHADDQRHYYGHGTFDQTGRFFLTPENDLAHERGVIGIYDAFQDYKKIHEVPSNGIGPHQIVLDPTSGALIVANGGILTHPNTGRAKLNLESMKPNVSWIAPDTGDVLHQVSLPSELHQLSLRHLSVSSDGDVIVGAQDQNKSRKSVPLVWSTRSGSPLTALPQPRQGWHHFNGYIGSVSHMSPTRVAVTSPRGHVVQHWANTTAHERHNWPDACGLAPNPTTGGGLLTTGHGVIVDLATGKRKQYADYAFDNHLTLDRNLHNWV